MTQLPSEYLYYVGIDWGSQQHRVCSVDRNGHRAEDAVPHTSEGLAALAEKLGALSPGAPERVAVAIEVPRGPVVETLLERGFHVFALNPKQLDRFRDRHTVAGAKDDRRDAWVLGDSLRTDRPSFRRVHVDDPLIVQLRDLSRLDDDLREELSRLTNRLVLYPPIRGSETARVHDRGGRCRPPHPGRAAPRERDFFTGVQSSSP